MDATPTALAAFGAGVLSVVSPAIAPLLPAFNAYLWSRGLAQIAAFLLAFSLVFVVLGAGATAIGQTLLEHLALVERIAGVTLAALGLRDLRAARTARTPGREAPEPATAGALVAAGAAGAALMFGWTPIAGVVLNQVLAVATSPDTIDRGLWLLAANAAGRALPLVALGVASGLILRRATATGRSRGRLQLIAGGVVALTGILIASGLVPPIAAALVRLLPVA